jgi:5-oxoprolinase (ATP-hydrolysing) subunit A
VVEAGSIDLNADIGERSESWRPGDDEALLALVTTAHIACGFHSGDPTVMLETVRIAARLGVAIGAHPSYPDREGFGRRAMDLPADRIYADVLYQVAALDGIARAEGRRVSSVKAHGALYNKMAVDGECAQAVARATRDFSADLWLVVPAGSRAVDVAAAVGLRVAQEAFCDRRYAPDGTLVSRERSDALVTDPAEAAARAVRLARDREVETLEGGSLHLEPSTLCLHGDTPGAAEVARAVRSALEAKGFALAPFSSV